VRGDGATVLQPRTPIGHTARETIISEILWEGAQSAIHAGRRAFSGREPSDSRGRYVWEDLDSEDRRAVLRHALMLARQPSSNEWPIAGNVWNVPLSPKHFANWGADGPRWAAEFPSAEPTARTVQLRVRRLAYGRPGLGRSHEPRRLFEVLLGDEVLAVGPIERREDENRQPFFFVA
jgi:hypothetical protein